MKSAPCVVALGFAGILAFAVAPASAQNRTGSVSRGRYYYGPRYYAPVRFIGPYYAFRPRVSLGFGLFIGYPIVYSSSYYYPDHFYPYAYPYPYARTYPAPGPIYYQAPAGFDPLPQVQNSVGVQPGPNHQVPAGLDPPDTGGLSFEIMPSGARLIVDGQDVGSVGEFTSTSPPLGVPVGRHHIDIVADGYRTMSSDVNVRPGEVIPFQGQMER